MIQWMVSVQYYKRYCEYWPFQPTSGGTQKLILDNDKPVKDVGVVIPSGRVEAIQTVDDKSGWTFCRKQLEYWTKLSFLQCVTTHSTLT